MGCEDLGKRVFEAANAPLPAEVRAAAERLLLNVSAAAIGGSRHPVVEKILALSAAHGGAGIAPVVGRSERSDMYFSALSAGTAARVLDFDDMHLATLMNPSAAPFGALVALAGSREIGGERALKAFALGCEVGIRLAIAISPNHYEVGWDATGTCGVIGAAVTGALLLGADEQALTFAIGIAAGQTVGQGEAVGTSSGTIHAGKAASSGVIAALLAPHGFTASPSLDDEPFGFFYAFPPADPSDIDAVVAGIGSTWRLLDTGIKPFPSASMTHPPTEAALGIRDRIDLKRIVAIRVAAHPRAAELTSLTDPQDDLEAATSTPHGVAAALVDGRVGVEQYLSKRIGAPEIVALRKKVRVLPVAECALDATSIEVELDDGTIVRNQVSHAHGGPSVPLTDDELHAKVMALVEPLLPGAGAQLVRTVQGLHGAQSASAFVASLASLKSGAKV